MAGINFQQLEAAQKIIAQNKQNIRKDEEIANNLGIEEYLTNLIEANTCSTIGLQFKLSDIELTMVDNNVTKLIRFPNYTEKEYDDFCKEILDIDLSEQYNCSRTLFIKGTRSRVYAMMPPLTKSPIVTISTTKQPPQSLYNQVISDELWNEIVHNNFIIAGASGSGKTYLTNYLLSKFIGKSERIALIEEFGELIPPNDITLSITVPPPKPGEESLLNFVTQQSNLMRLDAFYVGEVKGPEAWPMVVNMASGTRGGCTIHGETFEHALARLRALCQQSCTNNEAIDAFISKALKYVVIMRKRQVYAVHKLTGVHTNANFGKTDIYLSEMAKSGNTKVESTKARISL